MFCELVGFIQEIIYYIYFYTQCYFDAKYQNRLALTTQAIGHSFPIFPPTPPPYLNGSLFQFIFFIEDVYTENTSFYRYFISLLLFTNGLNYKYQHTHRVNKMV